MHHAEHVGGIEMPGLTAENFDVDALGGIEVALAMQCHPFPKALTQQAGILIQG
jgi:hypothetical protein